MRSSGGCPGPWCRGSRPPAGCPHTTCPPYSAQLSARVSWTQGELEGVRNWLKHKIEVSDLCWLEPNMSMHNLINSRQEKWCIHSTVVFACAGLAGKRKLVPYSFSARCGFSLLLILLAWTQGSRHKTRRHQWRGRQSRGTRPAPPCRRR